MRPQFQIEITGTFVLGLAWCSLVSSIVFGLAGCGGGGSAAGDTGRLDLSVTHAPVDDASSVIVSSDHQ